jgi:flagellar basal-body rod modification protein FlgD
MSVESVYTSYGTSSATSEETSSSSSSEKLDMNQFLNLFITQLQYQDPLNPLDSADFTAQLAQFTTVEQLYGMNSKLGDISEALTSQSEQRDELGFIGKTVKAEDNTMRVDDETVQSGSYTIDESGYVTIDVYDSDGVLVRSFYEGWKEEGDHEVDWDGRDNTGTFVDDGTYTFEINAKDEDGLYISYNTYISGEVTGITYENGQSYLMIGDRLISTDSNIIEISQTTENS